MRKTIALTLFLFTCTVNNAQKNKSMVGEYYLRGVMETASGFKLNPDSTFEFFLSYGALDRYGSGKWTTKGNKIFFTTTKKHDRDFALINSKKTADDFVTIKITEPNEMLSKHVYCILKPGEDKDGQLTDARGEAKFTRASFDSISLIFEFCPERISVFPVPEKSLNYFEFRFEHWVFEVYFDDFSLDITSDGLSGRHPLMEGDKYRYEK